MEEKFIHTKSGVFVGYEKENCMNYSGIRYAISTAFSKPEEFVYKDIFYATNPAPFAVQVGSVFENLLLGMDYEKVIYEKSCQYLSMTLPKNAEKGDKLPVMVFFHGGSYTNGGLESITYDRIPMVKENKVILVSVNYRLGILGFTKDENGNPSNNGVLDAIEALKWIKNNIEEFGGDADNITIFGQSAGGDLTRFIMLSEGSENLYKRAIIQSDPMGTDTDEKEDIRKFMIEEIKDLDDSSSIEDIQNAYIKLKKKLKPKSNAKYLPFSPIFGVYPVIRKEDLNKKLERVCKDHEILIGYTKNELRAYIPTKKSFSFLDGFFVTKPILNSILSKLKDKIIKHPTVDFANLCKENNAEIYLYEIYWEAGKKRLGACHGSDLILLFGGRNLIGKEMTMALSEDELMEIGKPLRKAWADFAKTGEIQNEEIDSIIKFKKL